MRKILFILSIALLVVSSCRKDELDPLRDLEVAPFVYFDIAPDAVVGVDQIANLTYTGRLLASGSVASYELQVYGTLGGVISDTAVLATYTTFPLDLNIGISDIVNAIGITVGDVDFGDSFGFIGTVTAADGTVYYGEAPVLIEPLDADGQVILEEVTYDPNGNVDENVYDPANGYNDGFDFNFIIGCPENTFDPATFAGTYRWVTDPWETWVVDGIFEIVAGPGENQITCIDVFDHPVPGDATATYDMIIDVDPITGAATIAKQNTWHPANWGLPDWGQGYHNGTGQIFGCANMLMLNLVVFDEFGHSWGSQPYGAVKQ